MYPRTEYEMSEDDLKAILEACKPTPVMFLSGGTPMGGSPQENANAAWSILGNKMGFDPMSVRPIEGKPMRFFTAIPSETESQRTERLKEQRKREIRLEIESLSTVIQDAQGKIEQLKTEDSI